MKTQKKKEDPRRSIIRKAIIFLRDKPFSLRKCPAIMELIIKADNLENLPAEHRKRVLTFHEQELRILLAPEYTLIGSVGAVERYLDSLPSKSMGQRARSPFLDKAPDLDGLGK